MVCRKDSGVRRVDSSAWTEERDFWAAQVCLEQKLIKSWDGMVLAGNSICTGVVLRVGWIFASVDGVFRSRYVCDHPAWSLG